ncbi:MAG TPA: hypothetical protein VH518_08120 [Tepidisphaeraceae bacterium]|jgi:hypothetical protein
MIRWLFRIFAVVSLALCLLIGAAYAICAVSHNRVGAYWTPLRGRFVLIEFTDERDLYASIYDNWPLHVPLTVRRDDEWIGPSGKAGGAQYYMLPMHVSVHHGRSFPFVGSDRVTPLMDVAAQRFGQLSQVLKTPCHYWLLFAPGWYLMAITGVLPALWLCLEVPRILRRRRRARAGHCLVCGYDLRASPERCPECGTTCTKPACISSTPQTSPADLRI